MSPKGGKAGQLTKHVLESVLPSRGKYSSLEGDNDNCGFNSKNLMDNALDSYSSLSEYIGKIAKAQCCAAALGGNSSSENEYCDYLYFFTGDLVLTGLDDTKFKKAMEDIYQKMETHLDKFKCTNKYPTITIQNDELFQKMKKVHDYYRDYERIEYYIKKHNYMCDDTVSSYLEEIKKAYDAISGKCPNHDGSSDEPYCNDFNNWFRDTKYGTLLQKKCLKDEEAALQEQAVRGHSSTHSGQGSEILGGRVSGGEGKGGSDGGGSHRGDDDQDVVLIGDAVDTGASGVTPGAVAGGTIATIGLPAIGFFLYKYTNLFDGIKNSLFGGSNNSNNRRGRRSIGRRQHIDDTFTENDSSTLGDDGSTTLGGGGSSTDVSTIYNEPPRRSIGRRERAGTNNRRPGNIRYYAT
ncbi:KIR protein [Plasmodium knowlesi strain H]|uniref:KIR protein n=2 Tax=Plasmodium knowlesi TaxID=5850 RepID=B3L822_PLAKH|nr:KIR protein [Plasmodium knowlesi strain H]OTN64627.1 KIR protein [Plasmodium knowlesi]CAA9989293.1 KIR protein [Plasmodium knowlesi strain H]VVS78767.1 KIR protein [Plasmodium knowlesi strain H]|eukprot:XP_002261640.1 KIR protein [Plasmodium knowlesi strain H]